MEQIIVFGAGCFWGVEKYFKNINGVLATKVGYAGGEYLDPDYHKVLSYRDNNDIINHNEVLQVNYDDSIITTLELLKYFWQSHDSTQLNRQGNDIGNNYRSSIYFTTKEQEVLAQITKNIYQKILINNNLGKIVTEIKPLDVFYDAEDYHQDYLTKNPNGYCPNHSIGVGFTNLNKDFYQSLAKDIYGKDSEYYRIAYNHGTEPKFCKMYDIFKETPEGFFIDKISGHRLFATQDRFNSGTGWLSFYKEIPDSVIEIKDLSFGMIRTEVRAAASDVHLGHVFDGEFREGKRRFCINAEVLEFVPHS